MKPETRDMKEKIVRGFRWLKTHPNQWVRKGSGLLLMVGGLLGPFLPVLGVWMIPLGLILLFANSPIYWRLRRRYVARRRGKRLAREAAQTRVDGDQPSTRK